MRDAGSHAPSGTLADLQSAPRHRLKGFCENEACRAGLPHRGRRFCGPCYDERLTANIARNRSKYAKKKPEARG